MPVSGTVSTASASVPGRARSSTWPPARRVLERVVEQVGEHLAQPVAIDVDDELGLRRWSRMRHAALLGDVLVELDRLPDRVGRSVGSRRSVIVPVSASEMSISVFSIATTRSDSSRQSASASRSIAGIVRRQRRLGDAAQPRHRRAQIVRDVVERAAHAGERRRRCDRASR